MEANKKANLFIVGAMRAGTTSLMEILEQHPAIYASPIKEPHYFVDELPKAVYNPSTYFSAAKYFKNDFPKKLHIAHIQDKAQYNQLFTKVQTEKYRVEASTCYLHAPNVAENIKRYNPEAKIIILLRDPLERMHSHFYMDKGLLKTTASFQHISEEQIEAYHRGKLNWYSHLNMSCYDKAVYAFRRNFQEVFTIAFKDYTSNKERVLEQLAEFLDIENFSYEETVAVNSSRELKFQKLYFILKQLGMKRLATAIIPSQIRHRIFQLIAAKDKKKLDISEKVTKELHSIFQNESSEHYTPTNKV